jgi:hypothetical protein
MKIINISPSVQKSETPNNEPINLFYQFFIHKVNLRAKEIKKCLKFNVQNPHIDKIYLLNERLYTDNELGIISDKIIQIVIGNRLKFNDIFKYINENKITGYNVIINADIFLDTTIENLKYSQMHLQKQAMAILRYEYAHNLEESKVFGPRFDSQDTWIFHSNYMPTIQEQRIFNFEFGKPGCDNKFVYLLNILDYEIINDPVFIKTYHVHESDKRDYTNADYIHTPWAVIIPANVNVNEIRPSLGIDLYQVSIKTDGLTQINFHDNLVLFNYIQHKLSMNQNFIIPRIAGLENNYAVEGEELIKSNGIPSNEFMEYINNTIHGMKNNAGIKLTDLNSIMKYSNMYMESFNQCEIYTCWEPHGEVYKYIAKSHDYMRNKYSSKMPIWAFALDIFHYIKSQPWTLSLKRKRILIISAFEESIKEKIPIRKEIYGIDLFPECEILTIKPPQTQGSEMSEEFEIELNKFFTKLDEIKNNYDVALVSAGGYGNLICSYIYKSGKSSIYVGGVLQMYFGINGSRWIRERPDILRLYLNKYWSRPKESEKPKNHSNIEGSCYW